MNKAPYIFIHIPKNGGMTIRHAPQLKGKVFAATSNFHKSKDYTASLNAKMKETNDHPGHEHARYQDLKPDMIKHMTPFAIVRNPWDRVVSRYFFAKKVIEVEKKVPESYADVSSFEAFLEERHKWGTEEFMWHRAVRGWYPAFDHVVDPTTGKVPVDILRFESYNLDFKAYFGIAEDPKPRNVTLMNKGSYKDIYTPETVRIVGDWYSKDIDYFGYDFGSGPRRNTWMR